jgi:hypothetical protein
MKRWKAYRTREEVFGVEIEAETQDEAYQKLLDHPDYAAGWCEDSESVNVEEVK